MKVVARSLFTLLALAVPAYAAPSQPVEGFGLLTWLLLGFASVIIVFQSIPALALLGAMCKGLLASRIKEKAAETSR